MDDALFTTDEGLHRLATELLSIWIPRCRWFGGKARGVSGWRICAHASVGSAWLIAVEVQYNDDSVENYAVPLRLVRDGCIFPPEAVIDREADVTLIDAAHDEEFRVSLFLAMAGHSERELRGEHGAALAAMFPGDMVPPSRVLKVDQSNTSLLYGERLFVKLYRKLVPGLNPDAEISRFLSERTEFRHVPAFCASIEWRGAAFALGVELVPHHCDGWALALREFRDFAGGRSAPDAWHALARLLGQRTGEMHVALASDSLLRDFAPEPFAATDAAVQLKRVQRAAANVCDSLHSRLGDLPPETRSLATDVIQRLRAPIGPQPVSVRTMKCRIHGDYHLGQVLFTGDDFVITDFEGEPARSIAKRREKQPPLRDVAGMLRSIHYAANAGRGGSAAAESWAAQSQKAFLDGWRTAVAGSVLSCDEASERELLHLFLIEKALYEVAYELNNRPDWLAIPLLGLLTLLPAGSRK